MREATKIHPVEPRNCEKMREIETRCGADSGARIKHTIESRTEPRDLSAGIHSERGAKRYGAPRIFATRFRAKRLLAKMDIGFENARRQCDLGGRPAPPSARGVPAKGWELVATRVQTTANEMRLLETRCRADPGARNRQHYQSCASRESPSAAAIRT